MAHPTLLPSNQQTLRELVNCELQGLNRVQEVVMEHRLPEVRKKFLQAHAKMGELLTLLRIEGCNAATAALLWEEGQAAKREAMVLLCKPQEAIS